MNDYAGAMRIGGETGMDQAGAYDIGGAIPKRIHNFLHHPDEQSHADLYHKILNFSPHEWEAVRESAHQLMGGAASPMWGEIGSGFDTGGAMDIGGEEPTYNDLRDVVMTPSRGGAARLLELENDVRGSGFKKALKKAIKHTGKILKGSKKHLETINEVSKEIGEMGGPVGDYANRVHGATSQGLEHANKAEAVYNAAKNAKPGDIGNTKENIRTGVQLANAALTGNNAKERAENVKNVVKGKVQEKLSGSGLDTGGAEDIGGRMMDEAGAMDIGGAMEVGAGNMSSPEDKKKKKKKGGKVRKIHPKRIQRKASPEALPLERASKDVQEPVMVDHHKGRKLHDPRKHR